MSLDGKKTYFYLTLSIFDVVPDIATTLHLKSEWNDRGIINLINTITCSGIFINFKFNTGADISDIEIQGAKFYDK